MIEFAIITVLILLNAVFVAAEFAIVGAPRAAIEARAGRATAWRSVFRRSSAIRSSRIATSRPRSSASRSPALASACMASTSSPRRSTAPSAVPARRRGSPRTASPASSPSPSSPTSTSSSARWCRSRWRCSRPSGSPAGSRRRCCGPRTCVYPFVVTLNGLGNVLLKAIGVNRQAQNSEQYDTPEELQLIVQESEELGALRSESSQMLQELFEFGDLTAGQVMVPRVRIVGIPVGDQARRDPRDPRRPRPHALSRLREGPRSHRRHGPHQGSAAAAAERTSRSTRRRRGRCRSFPKPRRSTPCSP